MNLRKPCWERGKWWKLRAVHSYLSERRPFPDTPPGGNLFHVKQEKEWTRYKSIAENFLTVNKTENPPKDALEKTDLSMTRGQGVIGNEDN